MTCRMAIVRCLFPNWTFLLFFFFWIVLTRHSGSWAGQLGDGVSSVFCKMSLQREKLTYISEQLAYSSASILKQSADLNYN
jgi:hypothetical protein